MVFDFLNEMQPTFVRILYNSTDLSVPAKFLENLPPMHVGGREEGHRHEKNSMFNVGDFGFISLVVLHRIVKPTYLHFEKIILIL